MTPKARPKDRRAEYFGWGSDDLEVESGSAFSQRDPVDGGGKPVVNDEKSEIDGDRGVTAPGVGPAGVGI